MHRYGILIFFFFMGTGVLFTQTLVREDFNNLSGWKELKFAKIKRYSEYSIEKADNNGILKAESHDSASGIIYKKTFNIYDYPVVTWKWKIEGIYKNGDATRKSGDDFSLRVYIIFKYDPEKAGFGKRLKYNFAKALYGEYPPDSGLSYLWANKLPKGETVRNPYANSAAMMAIESGNNKAGEWLIEKRNIVDDYKKIFGENPPAEASLAIMNDSDNTHESSVSYLDYIELKPEK